MLGLRVKLKTDIASCEKAGCYGSGNNGKTKIHQSFRELGQFGLLRLFWEQETTGSNPVFPTMWGISSIGRACGC